ncbi:hypothetical protein MMC21_003675 [Puttea exsequens]|nr:hypothetical protein [Puttea exsequens]
MHHPAIIPILGSGMILPCIPLCSEGTGYIHPHELMLTLPTACSIFLYSSHNYTDGDTLTAALEGGGACNTPAGDFSITKGASSWHEQCFTLPTNNIGGQSYDVSPDSALGKAWKHDDFIIDSVLAWCA